MKRYLSSTRGRLTLLATALLAIGLGIADVGVNFALAYTQQRNSDQVLLRQADNVALGLEPVQGSLTYRGGSLPEETAGGIAVGISIVGVAGPLAQSPSQPLTAATLVELAAPVIRTGRPIWVDLTDSHGIHRRVFVRPVDVLGRRAALVASRSVGELQDTLLATTLLLTAASLTALVLGAWLTYWLAGRILRPVHQISALARTLSERELHRRVEAAVPDDELGELVATFNQMLGRLESSFNALGQFTSDASHELRTPLALMRAEVELTLNGAPTREEHQRVLRLLQSEIAHMSLIVDQLLTLARADSGALRPDVEHLDAADFLHETAARWIAAAGRHDVQLRINAPDSGTVDADPLLTRRILDNLIDNAIRHSPAGGAITVELRPDGDDWLFEVADQGPGVPRNERQRIFERFARVDSARTRTEGAGGAGLGLALCAAIAAVQKGEVRILDDRGPGAVFQLRVPNV